MEKLIVFNENNGKLISLNKNYRFYGMSGKINSNTYYHKDHSNNNFITILRIRINDDEFYKYKYMLSFQFNTNYQEILLTELPKSFKQNKNLTLKL